MIALNEVSEEPFLSRLVILFVVAIVITIVVYGVVGLIVKMDDIGLSLAQRSSPLAQKVGRAMVAGMPKLLTVISVVGVAAMLWVGGHIVLNGLDELGLTAPYEFVHHLEEWAHDARARCRERRGVAGQHVRLGDPGRRPRVPWWSR